MRDVYEIALNLKSNWSAVLGKQSKQFEGFIQKANTATLKLEKSITGMHTNLAKSYEGMFAGSQKQVEKLVNFSNYALQNVSASTQKIFATVEAQQKKVDALLSKNMSKIVKYTQLAARAREKAAAQKPGMAKDAFEDKAKQYEKAISDIEAKMGAIGEQSGAKLSKMMGRHFDILADSVIRKSSAVSKSTKLLIDNAISQWNRLKSQGGLKGTSLDAVDKAKGINQLVARQKQVYANLAQLREADKLAANVYHEQTALAAKATTGKQKAYHQELADKAQQTLKVIQKETIDTAKIAKTFTQQIRDQKNELAKSATITDTLKGWKAQFQPSKIKNLMQPLIANVAESGMLAGKGFLGNLIKSVKRGDELRGKLDAFKDKLAQVKQKADLLIKAGLVDPNRIIPNLKAVETELKKYENQLKQTKREYAKFSPKGKGQFKIDETIGDSSKIRAGIHSIATELEKSGRITKDNFEATHKNVLKIKAALEQHVKVRRRLEGTINAIKAEAIKVGHQLRQTENVQLRASMAQYIVRLKKHAKQIREELSKSTAPDVSTLKKSEAILLVSVRRTMSRIRQITSGATHGTPDKIFTGIRKEYEKLSKEIDKLKTKRFVSAASINSGKAKVEELKEKVVKYKSVLIELQQEYRRLQRLQRAGFTNKGIRDQKALLQEQIAAMRTHSAEVQRMSHHASRRIEQVQTSSLKGFVRRSWEMIRNFRWQVAAVIYLISRAVQAVKRVFMDTMGEIAKFRRDAMSLAAQYSFKMFGDMRKNFTQAYNFSRDLMAKLEIVAAETILTLDDVMMLTKTFAQAGVIPRTDEDLQRIATIGTAIKALTEGMANAGVQMKQELYAIIAGRQRATDQLAMMFRLQGKNIQKMIEDGKKSGKKMIEVLADALEPFSVLNEKLKEEWEAVINKMQIVWKMLKRFALEDSLLQSTKTLKAFIETFWNKTEGLTAKGREVAAVLRAGFESVKAIVVGIAVSFQQIFITLGTIVNLIMSMAGVSLQVDRNVKGVSAGVKSLLSLSEGILKITWLITETIKMTAITINAIISPINYLIEAFKALGSYAAAWGMRVQSVFVISKKYKQSLKEAADAQMELAGATLSAANKQLNDSGKALWNMIDNASKGYEDIETTMAGILELLKEINKEGALLGQGGYEITYATGVYDKWFAMQNEMQRAEAAQFKGPQRWEIEARQKIEALDELKMKTRKNIQDLRVIEEDYRKGILKMTTEQYAEVANKLYGYKEILNEVYTYEEWVKADVVRKTLEWNKKEEISNARKLRKYEQFMREVSQVSLTPKEKAQDWYQKMLIDVKELAVSSKFFADNMDKVQEALKGGLKIRDDNAIKQMNAEFDKFIAKASKAGAWNNVFEELNLEFAEYVRQAEKSNKIEKERLPELKKQFDIIKAQRVEQEKMNIVHQAYLNQLDIQTKKAAYLKGSYSPIKQRKGEIMDLKASHNRAMAEMQKKLEDYNLKWKENGEFKTEATAAIRAEGEAIEEMMVQMTKITERELQKKQMPIWNDLVEASNGWADGFTDALSNIVDGVGSVKEALNELQVQILKDTVKVLVKNVITDNLQDMLGTGLLGESTLFQKMFGKGKGKGKEKVMEITAKKPLPVYITNPGGTVPGAEGAGKMGELAKGSLVKPIPVFVTNGLPGMGGGLPGGTGTVAEGVSSVSQDLADISKEIADNTKEAEESSESWVDKIKDGFSSIGSKISDWLSSMNSSGGGGGGGGGSWFGKLFSMGSSAAASYYGGSAGGGGGGGGYVGGAMAEGGIITEPIVGQGLKSGEIYNFGEKTKYGENELVSPMKKLQRSSGGSSKTEYHMPIHLSAIDTQSGIQFLVKHSDVIQGQMVRSLKQNKPIRKGIQNAY